MGKVYRILFVWVGSEVLINRDKILCLIIKLSEHVGLYMYFAVSALDIFDWVITCFSICLILYDRTNDQSELHMRQIGILSLIFIPASWACLKFRLSYYFLICVRTDFSVSCWILQWYHCEMLSTSTRTRPQPNPSIFV